MQDRQKGDLIMLICPLVWSLSGLLAKAIPWPGMFLAGARGVLTALSLYVYMRVLKIKFVFNKKVLGVAIGSAGCILTYFCALKLTTAANAIILQYLEPVFLLILSAIFLKTRYARADIIAVLTALAGMVLLFMGNTSGASVLGSILAVISGVFYALHYLFLTDTDTSTRMSGLTLGSLLSGVGLFTADPTKLEYTSGIVIAVVAAGLFQVALPNIALARAMKLTTPLSCSLIASLEIVFNPLWVYVFTGEAPGVWTLAGGIVIVGAITWWCIYNTRKYKPEQIAPEQN